MYHVIPDQQWQVVEKDNIMKHYINGNKSIYTSEDERMTFGEAVKRIANNPSDVSVEFEGGWTGYPVIRVTEEGQLVQHGGMTMFVTEISNISGTMIKFKGITMTGYRSWKPGIEIVIDVPTTAIDLKVNGVKTK